MDQALTRQKLDKLRAIISEGDRVAILLQDDPDPDAMSSAIALRTLLGRNKLTTPIFAFSPVTRPENRSMIRLLDIEVVPADTKTLEEFDKIAMVDVEPPYFGDRLPRADIVIDHHPGYETGIAPFEDIRVGYGATATIMTEYLVSAGVDVSERLATALLYGIRSDTLALSRRVTEADVEAFTLLYPIANYSLLKQIDRPELPLSFARILSRAMPRLAVRNGLIMLHLGRVDRDDLIVHMADFCLQFESVEWAAVSGRLDQNLVIAVRNHGLGRANAGETVKRLFGDIGSAGGHRNMAKAVVPLAAWRKREGTTRDKMIEVRLRELFTAAMPVAHQDSEPVQQDHRRS
ncbi:MAG TPA: bifunctional oligoribonuclease/PAP phosphatase NrnA [Candidatus Binataceae bacterium]|jgi:nanoRNase/pAp phosphatase (c-di-AMP/oligoRNAs hydrolase)|nr:bifunctional oligoribonuclease/PAP phosphatase NrnA [Candidatus Binataceae bacterium]